ncbi:uncharacterized protein TNCV_2123511 [Trichonephila clavipes]|nr:uncharacterized protein TNCV_2123511 [Trichonephila clavipes]
MDGMQMYTVLSQEKTTSPYFQGVYSRDTLPPPQESMCAIVNSDDSSQPGTHWWSVAAPLFRPPTCGAYAAHLLGSALDLSWIVLVIHRLPPTALGRQVIEEATPRARSLHWRSMGLSQWHLNFPDPEIGIGSGLRVLPELFFSGSENVEEFLECIENNVKFYEIPSNLPCAYLNGHLRGRALDWFEIFGYSLVQGTATNFAQLKEALAENFPVVQNKTELK